MKQASHPILKTIIGTLSLLVIVFYGYRMVPHDLSSYKLQFNFMFALFLFAIACNIVLFIALLKMKAHRGPAMWFMFLPLLNAIWVFTVTMQYLAIDPIVGHYWQRTGPIAWIAIPVMMLFFVLSYIDERTVPRGLMLWVMPLLAVLILQFVAGRTGLITYIEPVNQVRYPWGWESELSPNATLVFIWAVALIVSCLVMMSRSYRGAKSLIEKRQRKIFLIGLSVYISIAIVFDIVLPFTPIADTFDYPPTSFAYTTLMALIIGYGIIKYGLFKVSPAALSGTILHSLTEAVIATDRELNVQFTNHGTEVMTGFSQSSLRSEPINVLFDAATISVVSNRLHQAKHSFTLDDVALVRKGASSLSASLTVSPVYDDNGTVVGYIFVFMDISEIKKKTVELAEEKASVERKVIERTKELSEAHARLSASINSLKIGFIMTGTHDEILSMNTAANTILENILSAQHMKQPEAWNVSSLHAVLKSSLEVDAPISKSKKEMKPVEFDELQYGRWFVHMFIAPVTENDTVIGSVILLEDITEAKALNRSKDEFFIIASHELRTPLTKIRGSAEIMRDVYRDHITSEEALKMLNEIEHSSGHLIDIVNDFIQLSELEQGKVAIEPSDFNVTELAREVVRDFLKQPKEGVSVRVHGHGADVHCRADKEKTRNVLHEFISNALKFTDKGEVAVDISSNDSAVRVLIRDTGKGISLDTQGMLFRKFQQAGQSLLSRDGEGTGLGLYINKLLIEKMGGDIGLEWSEVGRGSTFYFTLPLA